MLTMMVVVGGEFAEKNVTVVSGKFFPAKEQNHDLHRMFRN